MESRRYFGDWEADTVEGKLNSGRLATLVERKTLYTIIAKMETRHEHCFNAALLARVGRESWLPMRTIAADNGAEFSRHAELSRELGAEVYFAEPHSSWQRGRNENTNGLIRQYFAEEDDFRAVSAVPVNPSGTTVKFLRQVGDCPPEGVAFAAGFFEAAVVTTAGYRKQAAHESHRV